jgi:hypothetical protein
MKFLFRGENVNTCKKEEVINDPISSDTFSLLISESAMTQFSLLISESAAIWFCY